MNSQKLYLARPLLAATGGQLLTLDRCTGGSAMLERLAALGFVPGTQVQILNNRTPGAIVVVLKESRMVLSYAIAQHVWVR
jgi:ferrous iron transport protein A